MGQTNLSSRGQNFRTEKNFASFLGSITEYLEEIKLWSNNTKLLFGIDLVNIFGKYRLFLCGIMGDLCYLLYIFYNPNCPVIKDTLIESN